MKYQIYLNKETSEIINKMAELSNKKPSSFIKEMVEGGIEFTRKELAKNEQSKCDK